MLDAKKICLSGTERNVIQKFDIRSLMNTDKSCPSFVDMVHGFKEQIYPVICFLTEMGWMNNNDDYIWGRWRNDIEDLPDEVSQVNLTHTHTYIYIHIYIYFIIMSSHFAKYVCALLAYYCCRLYYINLFIGDNEAY